MIFVVLAIATALAAFWLILLCMVQEEDWVAAATCKVIDNRQSIDKLRRRDAANKKILDGYHGISAKVVSLFLTTDSKKEINKLEKQSNEVQSGNLRSVSILNMPGYVLQRKFRAIGQGTLYQNFMGKSIELYGRKYAQYKTKQLLAQITSYPIIGIALSLTLGALLFGTGNTTQGLVVLGVGSLLILILVLVPLYF